MVSYRSTTQLFKTKQVVAKAVVLAFFTFFYACSILISIKHFFYSKNFFFFFFVCVCVLNNVFFVRDLFLGRNCLFSHYLVVAAYKQMFKYWCSKLYENYSLKSVVILVKTLV